MALVLLTFVSVLIVTAILWYISKLPPADLRRKLDMIPGPPTIPIFGNAHMLRRGSEFVKQGMELSAQYGQKGLFRAWVGFHLVVIATKASAAEVILRSSKHMTKSRFYNFIQPWLGTGLLLSTGEKWYSRRKLITPTFHFKILEDFLQVFNEQSAVMQKRLESMVGKSQGFDVNPFVTLCALDIICETAMGTQINAQANSESEYVKAIYRIGDLVLTRMKRPWLWPDVIFNLLPDGRAHNRCLRVLHGFTNKVIRERMAEFEQQKKSSDSATDADKPAAIGGRKRLAFLDMLLHSTELHSLTIEDIREEVDTFMFEGHDTTATAVCWAIFCIGNNPDVQEKLFKELDDIFGRSDRSVTMDDIKQLKYLECVIKEALRLFPSVPMFAREVSEDFEFDGMFIPKGSTAIVTPAIVHRDPQYYPEPEEFKPDRWLVENSSAGQHPFCFIPFSAGLRNCIGQKFAMIEEKVMLSSILRQYRIKALQSTFEELEPVGDLILRPSNGILIRIEKRFP